LPITGAGAASRAVVVIVVCLGGLLLFLITAVTGIYWQRRRHSKLAISTNPPIYRGSLYTLCFMFEICHWWLCQY